MNKILIFLTCFFLSTLTVTGEVMICPNGIIKLGKTTLNARHYNLQWRSTIQPENAAGMGSDGGELRAPWKLFDGTQAEFFEKISRDGANGYKIDYRFKSVHPADTANLSVELKLPIDDFINTGAIVNGKKVMFPGALGKAIFFNAADANQMEFSLPDGRLIVEFPSKRVVEFIDGRTWNQNVYSVRISFERPHGKITDSNAPMLLRFLPYKTTAIDLASVVNRDFADEVPGDGRGGWTDQGPDNDLRSLTQNSVKYGALDFPVCKSADGNRHCLAVAGKNRTGYPRTVSVKMHGEKGKTLALLHTMSWQPAGGTAAGKLTVRYQDGTNQVISIVSGVDLYDWWNPARQSNGVVAWHGSNPACGSIGLYASTFAIKENPIASLTFDATGDNPVWLTVGALLIDQSIEFPRSEPFTYKRNAEWRPLAYDRSVEKGSALDFSFLVDAPAGKYGRIQIDANGKYRFEKQDNPVRFYGANICFHALYMSKKECDMIADRLTRIGYNAVRIHHFDRDVVDRKNRSDSGHILPEQLDKLDYLIYALKSHGIYITTDVFTARIPAADEFPGLPPLRDGYAYKAMAMISPDVRAKLKTWTREVFTHKNPYTGLSWGEDPVFIGISILNENSIFFVMNSRINSEVRKFYETEFEKRCKERGIELTRENRTVKFNEFCQEVYLAYYQEMSAFLREIGVKAPLTDQNFMQSPNYNHARMQYDYVDNHIYWDHPRPLGGGLTPVQFCNYSGLRAELQAPRMIMPSRIYGKPFTVTEYDFPYPNRFRAEGAPVFGAYAAMQGWDAVYRFCYSGGAKRALSEVSIEAFDVANDVIRILSERIAAAFFVRGDVSESGKTFVVAVPEDVTTTQWQDYPYNAEMLGFYGKIGSVECSSSGVCTPALPQNTNAIFALSETAVPRPTPHVPVFKGVKTPAKTIFDSGIMPTKDYGVIRSSTGELTADFRKHTFAAATPRSEALVLPKGETRRGNLLSAKSIDTFSVVSAIAVDNHMLKDSARILLLHLTDVQLEGLTFSAPDLRIVTRWPQGQLIGKKGKAEVALKLDRANRKLYALSASGRRLATITLVRQGNEYLFTADTFCVKDDVVFAYELVKEDK